MTPLNWIAQHWLEAFGYASFLGLVILIIALANASEGTDDDH